MECHERWEEELVFDEQKTHQDACRAFATRPPRAGCRDFGRLVKCPNDDQTA